MSGKMMEIGPRELRNKLESGEPLTVLDIREAEEYAEWHIQESVNIPVYNALNAGKVQSFAESLDVLPGDRPVVAVCRAGKTSRVAARVLESRGYSAYSLSGGMRLWSGVWSEARVPLGSTGAPVLVQVRRNAKGCLSYVCCSRGEALVVDPCVDATAYEEVAHRLGASIVAVAETHIHADHLSRARDLCGKTGAALLLPENDRIQYRFRPLRDGETFGVGGTTLQVLSTPGHTGESACYVLKGEAVLTGDTLFVESVGRPDLERGDSGAAAGAALLHQSLHEKVLALADDVWVLPAHDSRPIAFDGTPIGARLGELRSGIRLLAAGKGEFVTAILHRLGSKPPNFHAIIAFNEGKADPGALDPLDLEAGPNRCAVQ
jgi:glyoxylase-like metal-dependent hydrolase (beta-lactamase superfamily II)